MSSRITKNQEQYLIYLVSRARRKSYKSILDITEDDIGRQTKKWCGLYWLEGRRLICKYQREVQVILGEEVRDAAMAVICPVIQPGDDK